VRTALLSADVHFKVAREFIERVQAQCVGQQVIKSVTPGQQIVKIINDELVRLLGEGSTHLSTARPLKVLMVGLHGSGKTTSTVKLGKLLKKRGYRPFVIACDVYRPAAIDQLEILAKQEELGFFCDRASKDVPAIAAAGLAAAQAAGAAANDEGGRRECGCGRGAGLLQGAADEDGRLRVHAQALRDAQAHARQPPQVLVGGLPPVRQHAVQLRPHLRCVFFSLHCVFLLGN
jgi:hypothetical protein